MGDFLGTPGQTTTHQAPGTKDPGYGWAKQFFNSLGGVMNSPYPTYQGNIDPGMSPTAQDALRRAQGYAQSGPSEILQGAQGSLGRFMSPNFANPWNSFMGGAPNYSNVDPNQRVFGGQPAGSMGYGQQGQGGPPQIPPGTPPWIAQQMQAQSQQGQGGGVGWQGGGQASSGQPTAFNPNAPTGWPGAQGPGPITGGGVPGGPPSFGFGASPGILPGEPVPGGPGRPNQPRPMPSMPSFAPGGEPGAMGGGGGEQRPGFPPPGLPMPMPGQAGQVGQNPFNVGSDQAAGALIKQYGGRGNLLNPLQQQYGTGGNFDQGYMHSSDHQAALRQLLGREPTFDEVQKSWRSGSGNIEAARTSYNKEGVPADRRDGWTPDTYALSDAIDKQGLAAGTAAFNASRTVPTPGAPPPPAAPPPAPSQPGSLGGVPPPAPGSDAERAAGPPPITGKPGQKYGGYTPEQLNADPSLRDRLGNAARGRLGMDPRQPGSLGGPTDRGVMKPVPPAGPTDRPVTKPVPGGGGRNRPTDGGVMKPVPRPGQPTLNDGKPGRVPGQKPRLPPPVEVLNAFSGGRG